MSRSLVSCSASVEKIVFDGESYFEFRPFDQYGPHMMSSYMWVPIVGDPSRWRAIRLTANEGSQAYEAESLYKALGGGEINGKNPRKRFLDQIFGRDPDRDVAIAVHGRQYLIATSAGSARAGLLGRYIPLEDERDLIKRALRARHIGVGRLERVGASHELSSSCRWYDNSHCPNDRTVDWWFTDGSIQKSALVQREAGDRQSLGGGSYTATISGFTYAIHSRQYRWMNGNYQTVVDRVVVTPDCDPGLLDRGLALAPAWRFQAHWGGEEVE